VTFKFSERVGRAGLSATLAVTLRVTELRRAGFDIISLGAGEPDFDTPPHIKRAAIEAIEDGFTKYTPVDGIPELKRAVIDKLRRDNQLEYDMDQVLVSCGGKQSFYNLAQALLGAGDEAVIPAPYWVSYPDIVRLADGTPKIVPAALEQGYKISASQLDAAINERTRLVVLNSPANPTGAVYSRDELAALGEILRRHPRVIIASDDIYEHIYWGDAPLSNIVNVCPDLYDRTVVLNGVSKAYAMTGWRIGYSAGAAPLIAAMKLVQSQSTSNPTSISQVAARAALEGDGACVRAMVDILRQRHDLVVSLLGDVPGVRWIAAQGALYLFADFREAIAGLEGVDDDVALADYLLQEAKIALVPGSAFGAPGHMRLSFATSKELLVEAVERLRRALD
jgi:aspartate aminotransferase